MTPEESQQLVDRILLSSKGTRRGAVYRRLLVALHRLPDERVHELADALVDTLDTVRSHPGMYKVIINDDGMPQAVPIHGVN